MFYALWWWVSAMPPQGLQLGLLQVWSTLAWCISRRIGLAMAFMWIVAALTEITYL